MPYCPICERKFDTRKGLTGHFRFKHKYELKQDRPAKETPLTRAIGKSIERRVSGDAVMKVMEEDLRTGDKGVEFRNNEGKFRSIEGELNEEGNREKGVIFRKG